MKLHAIIGIPFGSITETLPVELVGEQHDDPVLGSAFELADGGHGGAARLKFVVQCFPKFLQTVDGYFNLKFGEHFFLAT